MAEQVTSGRSARDYLRIRVRRLRWRIRLRRGIELGTRFLFWGLLVALIVVVAVRVLGHELSLGEPVAALLAAGTVLGFLIGACRRVTSFSAALAADEQLGLRERLSSALVLPEGDDEMVRALHVDAQRHARNVKAHEAVPISLPRRFWHLPYPALALLLALFVLPPLDLLHSHTQKEIPQVVREEVKEQAKELEEVEKKVEAAREVKPATAVARLSEEIKKISDQLEKERLDRTQALAKVSSLTDKVDRERKNILEKTDLKKSLGSAKDYEEAGDLAKALMNQDFKAAANELEKMLKKAESGEMTEAEKKKLAEELESMARALKDNPELSKALAEMARGLRADDLASLDLALDDALLSLADLGDLLEQLELMDEILRDVSFSKLALAGQIKACSACKSGKCGMCRGSGTCPGCGGTGKNPQGGKCSLCQGSGACPGCGGSGACAQCMGGVGMGPGSGIGARPTAGNISTAFKNEGIRGQMRPGKILAAIKVKGEQVRGESEAEITQAFMELRQNEEQAITRERIPAGMRDRVRDYFDAIDPHAQDSGAVEVELDAGTQP